MNYLITGANGFLGSNIVELLLQEGNSVLGISQRNNNLNCILNPNFKFIQNIKNNYNDIKDNILDFNPDVVLHTAWSGGNKYEDVNSLTQYTINFELGSSLLNILKQVNKKIKFIGFGSFSEYGILKQKAKEIQPDNPNTHYGASKSAFKIASKLFCKENNLEWSWVKPCFIYGQKDVSTRLIPRVIEAANNNTILRLNSCDTIIDYLHVDDFAQAIFSIINAPNIDGEVFNICSGEEYTLKNVLYKIYELMNKDYTIIHDTSLDRKYASEYICGCNEKIIRKTNWLPKINLECGLKQIIESKNNDRYIRTNNAN